MNPFPPRRPPQRLVAAALVPQNVLRALIGQSKKRCAAYAEMLAKLGAGMEQLRFEAERLAQENLPEPEVVAQAREHFEAVLHAFAQNRLHLEAQAHYELRLQEVLSRWLVVAAAPRPSSGPAPGMRRAPAERPAGPAPARPQAPPPGYPGARPTSPFTPYVVRPPTPPEPSYESEPEENEAHMPPAPPAPSAPAAWAYGARRAPSSFDRPNGPARNPVPDDSPVAEDEPGDPA